jgi:hypothetical protein
MVITALNVSLYYNFIVFCCSCVDSIDSYLIFADQCCPTGWLSLRTYNHIAVELIVYF